MFRNSRGFSVLQKISMSLMGVLVLLTFIGTNLQAIFWQSSEWLVSTVLPAVVVDLTNEERVQNHATPLQRNAVLDAAAKLKAQDMAKNEYFAHFSPDGVSPWHWFDEAGYVYAHAGENLAIHFTDSEEVVEAWMNSPAHRKNIVDSKFTEIGVGTAKGTYEGYDTVYVVQLFGTQAVPPPVSEEAPLAVASSQPAPAAESSLPTASSEVAALTEPEPVQTEDVVPVELSLTAEKTPAEKAEKPVLAQEASLPEDHSAETDSTAQVVADDLSEVVVMESPLVSTSSGLAIADIATPKSDNHAGITIASIATKPNALLQSVYAVLAVMVLVLLGASVVIEMRQLHFAQVAYGFLLILGMGGLWYAHSLLTHGAVIV